MPRQNDWLRLFGAKRRASDRALLMEVEKSICAADLREIELEVERQERTRAAAWDPDTAPVHHITEEMRLKIAAAFGRPLK